MCRSIARLSLFIVNGVTLTIGIALIVVGCLLIWAVPFSERMIRGPNKDFQDRIGYKWNNETKKHLEDLLEISSPLGKIALVFGIITALISFAGCCGAVFGIDILLYVYIGVIGGITLGLIICVIVYFAKLKGNMSGKAVKLYAEAARNYISFASGDPNSVVVAFIMASLKCCGSYQPEIEKFPKLNATDEFNGKTYENLTYPLFCCNLDGSSKFDETCQQAFTSDNSYIDRGCADLLKSVIEKHTNFAIYLVMAVIIVLLVLLVFASCALKS